MRVEQQERENSATCSSCAGFVGFVLIAAAVMAVNLSQLFITIPLTTGGRSFPMFTPPAFAGEVTVDPLDFSGSEFVVPAETEQVPPEIPTALIDYIGEDAAVLLVGATQRLYSEHHKRVSFYMLACIAKRESGGKVKALSPSGKYHGLLQISREHKRKMEKMGLVWDDPEDMTYFGALMYMWHGDKPWSVRYRARRDYKRHGFADLEVQGE